MKTPLRLLLAFSLLAVAARAEVRLAALFADHAVLQRDRAVPVWGWADPGETVRVEFAGQTATATAGPDGRWRADLPALPASSAPRDLVASGSSTVTLRDVLVGDVWVASGQSNMQWTVKASRDAAAEIAAAQHPGIREFAVPRVTSETPRDDVTGRWAVCSPESVGNFSAVAYYFARTLQGELGVPIGILHTSWGGTPVEAWMSPGMLAATPHHDAVAARWAKTLADYPAAKEKYDAEVAEWEQAAAAAKAEGKPELRRPRAPQGPGSPHQPSVLYHGMIAPLVPYALRGAIWYQGESNAGRAGEYYDLFSTMITGWRASWGQGNFPFLFVQLANFESGNATGDNWPHLREAQAQTLALPATGMAVTIDIGESKDIHPRNKQDVGRRLALTALAGTHGRDIEDRGPVFVRSEPRGGELRVTFARAEGLATRDGGPVQGFEVAGADGIFHPATGRIAGPDVYLRSDAVAEPVATRYAWANDPQPAPNLVNAAGLPAAPFRSLQR